MLIVSGHLIVDPADRDGYVADCRTVVGLARTSPGCLDFAITADSLDAERINVYERWESEEELLAFRGSGPDAGTAARILDASVLRYAISGSGPA
jgi:quinol monooxygenase YgiN